VVLPAHAGRPSRDVRVGPISSVLMRRPLSVRTHAPPCQQAERGSGQRATDRVWSPDPWGAQWRNHPRDTHPGEHHVKKTKKYLAAGGASVVAFAFAASAAQLNVDAGTLAAGTDNVACAEGAEVSYDIQNDGQGSWVKGFELKFTDNTCDGEYVNIAVFDQPAGVPNVSPQQVMNAIPDTVIADGELTFTLPGSEHGQLRTEDVEQVQLVVGENGDNAGFTYVR
jgi:hypothetical protein